MKKFDKETYIKSRQEAEFRRYHKFMLFSPFIFVILNFIFIYFILVNFELETPLILIASLLFLKTVGQFLSIIFSRRVSKKIMKPIQGLGNAVEEVSKGNYGVTIKNYPNNEIGKLIRSFNKMSMKLSEDEKLKQRYEENRKLLIANISHDLKTPITSIVGYVDGIREGIYEDEEKLKKYLNIIYHNATYTNDLIDDLFLFSKLDINQLEFDFVKTPISAYMEDVFTELKLELLENNHELVYQNLLNEEMYLEIDGKRLRQVIVNIVNNAVKYANVEELIIECSVRKKDGEVLVRISDNGVGINPEDLDTIFDKFYRLDNSRNKLVGGTGLGLAISKQIIEKHGGLIWAESIKDVGTTINFTLKDGGV